jgi:Ala-tRNA(Pro) deacylase
MSYGSAVPAPARGLEARLIAFLDQGGARYRMIPHAPEGRTDLASELRGHPLAEAAKCLVVRARMASDPPRHVLAVVPGDRRVDLDRVAELVGARRAAFADRPTAERLAGSRSGSIVPFAFDPGLELIVDPAVLEPREMYFNAAVLDRSIALDTTDYRRLVQPQLAPISLQPSTV